MGGLEHVEAEAIVVGSDLDVEGAGGTCADAAVARSSPAARREKRQRGAWRGEGATVSVEGRVAGAAFYRRTRGRALNLARAHPLFSRVRAIVFRTPEFTASVGARETVPRTLKWCFTARVCFLQPLLEMFLSPNFYSSTYISWSYKELTISKKNLPNSTTFIF